MRISSPRHAGASALALMLVLLLAGCGDDDGGPATTGTTLAPTTTDAPTNTATVAPSTTLATGEEAALELVRSFATDQVGMVDPVVGPFTTVPDDPDAATVEVRTRREGGGEDLSLPPTVVSLRVGADGWRIESAAGPNLRIDDPPPGQALSAGFVTPSGVATAYEATVIVHALIESPSGWRELGRQVTTAEGTEDAFWATRIETGTDAAGPGFLLATTTTGTELGPPAFALVPVRWERP